MKLVAKNVQIAKGVVQNVRFKVLPDKQKIRVASLHKVPLFVEKHGNKFLVAPRGELPVQASTPAKAFAKGVRRFWKR